METYGVHIKEAFLSSGDFEALCAGTRDFCPVLAALVSPVQNIIFLHGQVPV